ncbi:MAG: hypothetical protein R2794_07085 [Chitinophagales bacterium]
MSDVFKNPFRPGAGQIPPFLAGRQTEQEQFRELLTQSPILKNLILTGLRGVGKTVLLESLKPIAYQLGWFWAGTDMSESASINEEAFAIRLITDLATITSPFAISVEKARAIGFNRPTEQEEIPVNYSLLTQIYNAVPGLVSDKLKSVLEFVWSNVNQRVKGIVLAYDEAQNLKDKATDREYPLSVLLEIIQYLQRKEIPYLLVLTGLPTLFPDLVEARTYTERMFHIIELDKLTREESREAIMKPIIADKCPVSFSEYAINTIIEVSGGYPYFIQFFCKEAFDSYLQQKAVGIDEPVTTADDIIKKLDSDFYSGRWSLITDRQRELLKIIAQLPNSNDEFTVKEIATKSTELEDPFKSNYINSLLAKLIYAGLIYKNRHGKYSFAVPMLGDYINRQN